MQFIKPAQKHLILLILNKSNVITYKEEYIKQHKKIYLVMNHYQQTDMLIQLLKSKYN